MRNSVRHANKLGREVRLDDSAGTPHGGTRLGLIVNPVAGMGGAVGLKGTDGGERLLEAIRRGAAPLAGRRAARMLAALRPKAGEASILAAPGPMGADALAAAGLSGEPVGRIGAVTTAQDTRRIAGEMAAAGAGLILFVGGDGTARDVAAGALGVALLGIPSGVKMHSSVFGLSPEAAGAVAARFLAAPETVAWRDADIMDIDEALLDRGVVAAKLHAVARAPADRGSMQRGKAPSRPQDDASLEALADEIVAEMQEGRLYALGCGATMRKVKRRLGGDGTLLGVDVAMNRRLIAADVSEERLLRLAASSPVSVIVSVTGGQGFLFGRGNQQIGPSLLGRLAREEIIVLGGARKLTELDPAVLRVDTGDEAVDDRLAGYVRVRTAPGRSMMMRVGA